MVSIPMITAGGVAVAVGEIVGVDVGVGTDFAGAQPLTTSAKRMVKKQDAFKCD